MAESYEDVKKWIKKINEFIKTLDPAIRSQTFDILKGFMTAEGKKGIPSEEIKVTDVRSYFLRFEPKKPADCIVILAGYIYTQRGSAPFTLKELRELSDEVGATIPARIEMTLKAAQRKGKKLFQSAGTGKYRPSVYGENHFKKDLRLRPGKA